MSDGTLGEISTVKQLIYLKPGFTPKPSSPFIAGDHARESVTEELKT